MKPLFIFLLIFFAYAFPLRAFQVDSLVVHKYEVLMRLGDSLNKAGDLAEAWRIYAIVNDQFPQEKTPAKQVKRLRKQLLKLDSTMLVRYMDSIVVADRIMLKADWCKDYPCSDSMRALQKEYIRAWYVYYHASLIAPWRQYPFLQMVNCKGRGGDFDYQSQAVYNLGLELKAQGDSMMKLGNYFAAWSYYSSCDAITVSRVRTYEEREDARNRYEANPVYNSYSEYYWWSGIPRMRAALVSDSIIKEMWWYDTGMLSMYMYRKKGWVYGNRTSWHWNGQKQYEVVAEGETEYVTEWYSNGNVKEKGTKWRGAKDGKWWYYKENGQPELTEEYYRGQLSGVRTKYDEEGYLHESYTFYNGELHGTYTYYAWHSNRKSYEEYWEHGKPVGERQYFDENGNKIPPPREEKVYSGLTQ